MKRELGIGFECTVAPVGQGLVELRFSAWERRVSSGVVVLMF